MSETIFVGVIALILAFLYDKKVFRWGLLASVAILTVFCAIRWEWGNDMPKYEFYFDNFGLENVRFWEIDKLFLLDTREDRSNEIGWAVINLICQPIGFFGMNIILSIFEGSVVYLFIKKHVPRGYTTLAIFLYVFNADMMVLGCSAMREWLAICIMLIAISFAEKDKFLHFSGIVVIASLFHSSAILCLIIFFTKYLRNINFTFAGIVLFSFGCFIWIYLFGEFLGNMISNIVGMGMFEQYSGYVTSSESAATVGVASLLNSIVVLACLFVLNKSINEHKTLSWAYMGFVFLLPVASAVPLANRMLYYFEVYSLAVVPISMKLCKNSFVKFGLFVWILFWYLFMFYLFFNNATWKDSFMDYHTIFEAPTWR